MRVEIIEHEVDPPRSRMAPRDLAQRLGGGAPGAVGGRVGQPAAGERLVDADDGLARIQWTRVHLEHVLIDR